MIFKKPAGFLVYGPQTRLVLTCGEGCFSFLLEPDEQQFYQVGDAITVPPKQREFAINTSNYRYWDESGSATSLMIASPARMALWVKISICAGMPHWLSKLIASCFEVAFFFIPGDSRTEYQNGRLPLLYKALPLAFVVEQAAGMASDGSQRILESKLVSLKQRVPLIFGSG